MNFMTLKKRVKIYANMILFIESIEIRNFIPSLTIITSLKINPIFF